MSKESEEIRSQESGVRSRRDATCRVSTEVRIQELEVRNSK